MERKGQAEPDFRKDRPPASPPCLVARWRRRRDDGLAMRHTDDGLTETLIGARLAALVKQAVELSPAQRVFLSNMTTLRGDMRVGAPG